MPYTIHTLILAAGQAKRMGTPKQLLSYKKQTLLGRAIRLANALPIAKPIVVLGFQADLIKKELDELQADFVVNPNWKEGMGNSLAFGLNHALMGEEEPRAILVLLADQPKITKSHLLKLVQTYQQTEKAIIATEYTNGGGVPAIFDRSVFSDLMQLSGDKGARDLIRSHSASVNLIPGEHEVWDIDTPEDYQQLLDLE